MKKNNNRIKDISRILFGLILLAWGAAIFTGCDECDDCYIIAEDDTPPAAPRGLYSITGDDEVWLYWYHNTEEDFDFYVVYRSTEALAGPYYEIATTTSNAYIDRNVVNGNTYFYAITAVDEIGYESDLSYEDVFDTPRPEGYGVRVYDYYQNPGSSAFDFDIHSVTHGDDTEADIWFDYIIYVDQFNNPVDSIFYINVMDDMTDLQDFGYTESLDDVTWAPSEGWSKLGYSEIIPGHTYIVWTWDDHFAKLRVTDISHSGGWVRFDWAYQPSDDDLMKYELKVMPDGRRTTKQMPERLPGYGEKTPKNK
jgi:hypothetical protein